MLADDLGCLIAFDPLGAEIPARDLALGIEHKNGVVRDTVDKETPAQLALSQLRFSPLAVSDVMEKGAEDMPLLFTDWRDCQLDGELAAAAMEGGQFNPLPQYWTFTGF